jgi:hypothetical protein
MGIPILIHDKTLIQSADTHLKTKSGHILVAPGAFAAGAGPEPSFLGFATPPWALAIYNSVYATGQ